MTRHFCDVCGEPATDELFPTYYTEACKGRNPVRYVTAKMVFGFGSNDDEGRGGVPDLCIPCLVECVMRAAIAFRRKHKNRIKVPSKEQLRHDYDELLFAVVSKFEGETRHETALRYIMQREFSAAEATEQSKTTPPPQPPGE